jgi:site-specific DNA-cytosine methylase
MRGIFFMQKNKGSFMQKSTYPGNGTTTEFYFDFPYFDNKNIIVTINNAPAPEHNIIGTPGGTNADFPYIGGTIVFDTAPSSLDTITITRKLPISRIVDYQPLSHITPKILNQDLNYLTEVLKDFNDEIAHINTKYHEITNKESNDILLEKFTYPLPIKLIKNVGSILEKSVASKYTISDRLWAGHKKRRIENKKKGNGFGYCLFNDDSPYTSTLSRRYYKDGSEILIEQEDKNPRKITPRESARLQGFPDNFCIPKSDTKAYQQFGNSVAIPIVELIAKEIKRQILEK